VKHYGTKDKAARNSLEKGEAAWTIVEKDEGARNIKEKG
jgi:hypothetical protein